MVLALAVLPNTGLYAQTTITGKVMNEQGQPLAGASVAIKSTRKGSSKDANGSFSLSVPSANAVQQISFAGYQLKEVALGGQTTIEVQLALGSNNLTDVVVVGYGSRKKLEMTGSVSTIKGASIASVPVPSFDAALQGRAPGVQVSQQSVAPGGAVRIQVRGTGSVSSGTGPLYVINGIPIFQDTAGIADGRSLFFHQ